MAECDAVLEICGDNRVSGKKKNNNNNNKDCTEIRTDKVNQTAQRMVKSSNFHVFRS